MQPSNPSGKPDTSDPGDYFPYGNRDLPTRPEDADPYWYDRNRHEWRKRDDITIPITIPVTDDPTDRDDLPNPAPPDGDANARCDANCGALSDGYADFGA